MKRIITILLVVCMCICPMGVFAQGITVELDGKAMEFDVPPQLINDRTMVPMRAIFEALGAQIEWIEEDQLIFATRNTKVITMQINTPSITVVDILTDANRKIALDVSPFLIGSRTLVPVRAVSESLDAKVDWIDETQTVVITTDAK